MLQLSLRQTPNREDVASTLETSNRLNARGSVERAFYPGNKRMGANVIGKGLDDLSLKLKAAASGDEEAWQSLVIRFRSLLLSVARNSGCNADQAEDALQNTWLRLFEQVNRIREPEAIRGWLATTVRRESWRIVRESRREVLTDRHDDHDIPECDSPEGAVLVAEQREVLMEALSDLTPRARRLLAALVSDSPRYEEISRALGIPVGSIGPTRQRAIKQLRRSLKVR